MTTPSFESSARPPSSMSSQATFNDGNLIDITELSAVDYWVDALGVTETELRIAVAAVGESTQDVRDHLGR